MNLDRCGNSSQNISTEDQVQIDLFKDFLTDPTGKCGLCLRPGHTPNECPET